MLGGALSGGVMAGGSIAINAYQNGKLVKEGLKAPEGSEIRKTAEQIRAELNAGQKVSQAEYEKLGQLINANTQFRDILNTALNEQNPAQNEQNNSVSEAETGIQVGKATIIHNPYYGLTPAYNAPINRTKPQISTESVNAANSQIEQARAQEASGKSFRGMLTKLYEKVFADNGGQRTVAVNGVTIDGKQYLVTINKSAIGKVVSDKNLSGEKLAVFNNLDEIVENGEYVGSGEYIQHGSKRKDTIRFDYFETPVIIGEKPYIVTYDVEVFPSTNNYRTHRVINEMDLVPADLTDPGTHLAQGVAEQSPSTQTIPQTSANSQGENAAMSPDNATVLPDNNGEGGETAKLDKRINPEEIVKEFMSNLVTPKPGSAAAKNVEFAESEYGIKAYVVKKEVWNKYSFSDMLTSRNGVIFMSEEIDYTNGIEHEATHIMKQDGFEPYLDFLERTPDYVDLYSPKAKKLIQRIFNHVKPSDEVDISELADNDSLRLHLYDEINATLYGHIANGQIEGKRKREGAPDEIINLSDIVYDLEDYTAQMSAIHEEYKVWKRSGKPVVENHDGEGYNKENSSGSDNHGGEEGTLQRRGAASVPDERGRESSSSSGKGKGGVSTVEKSKSGDLMAGGEIHFSAVDNERAEGEERRSPSTVEKYRRKLEDERTKLKVKKLKLAQGLAMRAIELEDEYEKNVRE
ncbi:MAG: hypothetical protein II583_06715 [Oscillospiraceae bacterium]|nr:hypothetical protein [Oscillospiraceae bacterium]